MAKNSTRAVPFVSGPLSHEKGPNQRTARSLVWVGFGGRLGFFLSRTTAMRAERLDAMACW